MNIIRNLFLSVIVAVGLALVGCSDKAPERVQDSFGPVIEENGRSETASIIGTIDTKDGKNLKISMAGGTKNNFGELSFHKGEMFTISVESEYQGELEIGIMSIATEQVFSDIVSVEKGEFIITIPEDGDYRIYVGNKDVNSTTFDLKLSKAIEGPIV